MQSLELCSLTSTLLDEFKAVASSVRDRVEFRSDGIYRLLEERKVRYGKKRAAPDDKSSTKVTIRKPVTDHEVIDLL